MKVLLDTNAYSELMMEQRDVVERVRYSEQVLLSSIVLGELFFGFHNGTRYAQNLARLNTFLSNHFVETVSVSPSTAERFGLIATQLRRQGTPIPNNDIWIAAHAMETEAELLSFDGHFAQVENLLWTHLKSA